MKMNRTKDVNSGKVHLALLVALVVFIAVGCGGRKYVATNDPSSPLYRASGVDFHKYDTVVIEMNDVTTNNNEGVDEVKMVVEGSLEGKIRQSGIFSSVANTIDGVTGKAVVIKAKVNVNWGSRAARILGPIGAGRATINITYNVFDKEANILIARMDISDVMLGYNTIGGDAHIFVRKAAEKWNMVFINNVLQ